MLKRKTTVHVLYACKILPNSADGYKIYLQLQLCGHMLASLISTTAVAWSYIRIAMKDISTTAVLISTTADFVHI